MRTLLAGLSILAVMLAGPVGAQTKSGIISSDQTWSGTITVTGDVLVTAGTLTIMPGTVVKFAMSNDNIVEGGSATIWLVITQTGGLKAEGTEASPITFTSTSLSPAPGSWGRIEMKGLTSVNTLSIKHAVFEYAQVGVEMKENTAACAPTIDNCIFRNFSMSAIYGTGGCEPTISYCTFHNLGSSGIFMHGCGTVTIDHCYIYNAPTGIINAGMAEYTQTMNINHVTMYNIDMMMSSSPKWWTGYGVYSCNTMYSINVKNSIFVQSTLANMKINGWTSNHNYNCWHTGLLGLMNIEDGTPGPNSIEADPLFTNAPGGDFSLQAGSPCLNAADDGTHMGAWQGQIGVNDPWYRAMRAAEMTISQMPVTGEFSITLGRAADAVLDIYQVNGSHLRTISAHQADRIAWDCRTAGGAKVAPGIYLFKVQAGESPVLGNIVVAH